MSRMPRYQLVLGWLGILALLLFLYQHVLVDLAAQWSADANFGYGYLIPGVVVYLVWERRNQLQQIPLESSWWGFSIIAAGLFVFAVGQMGGIALLSRLSLIVVLFGLALFLGGPPLIRVLAFPLAFLTIMIPPPLGVFTRMTWPLQLFTARFSAEVLQLAGYPVFLDGIYLDVPTARLEVAQACSGFNSLISLAAVALLVAFATLGRWSARGILIASVLPIAVLANAIRVTLNIVFGFYQGTFHTFSGWFVFVIATGCLLGLAAYLGKASPPNSERVGGAAA